MLILITYDVDTTTKAGEKRLRRVAVGGDADGSPLM